ncbi:MAG TPA: phosphoenolpyruvate-utilizing N-terminal domain-containing protein, partial [Verrucomicrobiae bacterium]|nr:phosphoenolpyruvate-utilizing N-terminal domain-containing protein [Verrucomicrobiae bacterium]
MTSAVRLTGVAGAPGIAIGPVWRFDAAEPALQAASRQVPNQRPADAIEAAAAETARQLESLASRLRDLGREQES